MSEHATTDAETTPASGPKAAEPVVDARTNDAIPRPALEGADLQEQIAEKADYVPEAPAEAPAQPAADEPEAASDQADEGDTAPAPLTGYEGVADPFAATA